MEGVQLPLLPCMKGPGLTAVQECAQDTGSIHLDLQSTEHYLQLAQLHYNTCREYSVYMDGCGCGMGQVCSDFLMDMSRVAVASTLCCCSEQSTENLEMALDDITIVKINNSY